MKKASYTKPEINVIKAETETQLLGGSPGSDPIIIGPGDGSDSGNADGEANSKTHGYTIQWFYEDYDEDEDERRWRK